MSPTTIQSLREKITLDIAPDGILWVDEQGQILLANPVMERLTGYSESELVGQNVSIFLPASMHERHTQHIRGYFHTPRVRAMGGMDMTLMRKDQTLLPVDISLGYWEDEGEKFAVTYIRDASERKAYEESLRHQATHDELTKLPNRWLLAIRLEQAMAQARRNGRLVGLILLDLDGFKNVNDSYGHSVGDELLLQVSQQLRENLRDDDTLARLGGDEFAVLLSSMRSEDEALTVVEKLLQVFDHPYKLRQHQIHASGSFGLSFYPRDATDPASLLRFADLAMYQAKRGGRATYACYSPEMDQHAQEHMAIQVRLKEATKHGMFKLLYQPQVDCRTGHITGAEALIRWSDEVLGDVSPAKFIPIAEATGLIFPLSDWVMNTACEQIAAWESEGTPIRVAINISAQQFRRPTFLSEVKAALQRSGATPGLLEIEITETAAMTHPTVARDQIRELQNLGCGIVLDDFGTGYSSLGYLKEFELSQLKIDQGFVSGIIQNEDDVKIAKSVIALAKSFDLSVVAEGVETEAQLDLLREMGCETYQGWFFSKAIEPSALSAMLA